MKKDILLSFVGTNDAGKLSGDKDGAILNCLSLDKFDSVYLLWNKNTSGQITFEEIVKYLKDEIKKRKLAKNIYDFEFSFNDVTDHNEIYKKLKIFTDSLNKSKEFSYTAAVSSGTPAMQVCWILLAESGDFSETNQLKLIKVKDPRFGKTENIPVKIDTSLPKIIRLKNEIDTIKKDLIPKAVLTISKPELKIGDIVIDLSPILLSYYKYFTENLLSNKPPEKFS
ncbi:MAG: hypothetical protein JXA68_09580 [Ignavibacteriales bacterium]|nr:hypothetical protein [Ignavibacteriales bacterium]